MVANKVTVTDDQLIVEPEGIDKVLGLKNRLVFPLDHIEKAEYEQEPNEKAVWRLLGYGGIHKRIGTFTSHGKLYFCNFDRQKPAVVITLQQEHYFRLVLAVEQPEALVAKLTQAVAN